MDIFVNNFFKKYFIGQNVPLSAKNIQNTKRAFRAAVLHFSHLFYSLHIVATLLLHLIKLYNKHIIYLTIYRYGKEKL